MEMNEKTHLDSATSMSVLSGRSRSCRGSLTRAFSATAASSVGSSVGSMIKDRGNLESNQAGYRQNMDRIQVGFGKMH